MELEKLQNSLLPWLESLRHNKNQFCQSRSTAATAFSRCFAIMVAHQIGRLDQMLSSRQKAQLAAEIRESQDEGSGLFHDKRWSKALAGSLKTYPTWQLSYFSTVALKILGFRPQYPLCYLHFLTKDTSAVEKWLNGLNWKNPWTESNLVMFALSGLKTEWEGTGLVQYTDAYERILHWHDCNQRKDCGYWGKGFKVPFYHGMYGAYHQYLFYFSDNRPLKRMGKIIDRTLMLQRHDGLFSPVFGSGACQDMDAVATLVGCSLRTTHRRSDVKKNLRRAWKATEQNFDPSGGMLWKRPNNLSLAFALQDALKHFIFHKNVHLFTVDFLMTTKAILESEKCARSNCEGWTDKDIPILEPDLFSTFARLDALRNIGLIIPEARMYSQLNPIPMSGLGCDINFPPVS